VLVDDRLHEGVDGGFVGDVERHDAVTVGDVGCDHGGALRAEERDRGGADARRPSGDQRDPAGPPVTHR
jgi:hypothetical protein